MKFKELREDVKSQLEALYISLFSQEKQICKSMKLIDKKIKKIIINEKEFLAEDRTLLCRMYWKAFKEMIEILVILKDKESLNEAFRLIAVIMDGSAFHFSLPEITQIIHRNHPKFIRISWDVQGGPNNDGD